MKILHPNNTEYLSLVALKKYYKNGYYSIIGKKEEEQLNYFLKSFEDYRKTYKERITNKKLYDNLPFSIHTPEWKERQKDAKIIDKLLKDKKKLTVLDIGSWNGWLCNYLAKKGHNLTAINMFIDKYDGLKTAKNYKTNFVSLQLITDEIYRIKHTFDVIIFNRNWSYFLDHQKTINDAKQLLSKNGVIVFTGLAFYKNSIKIKINLETNNTQFKNRYKIPLLYTNSKGYLDFDDKPFFIKNKIQLFSYHKYKNNIKKLFPKKPVLFYGVYKNDSLKC